MLTYTALRDKIESNLRATSGTPFSAPEIDEDIADALREVAQYSPYERMETYTIESRNGTASGTTPGSLVDATKSQFVSGDVGKVVFNKTDRTWALIKTVTSTSAVVLSKDIMISGDSYVVYNKGCTSEFQINIEDVTDYIDIASLEYPLGQRRNYGVMGTILTIKKDSVTNSKAATSGQNQPNTEVHVWFKVKHRVSQLTDLAGAVNNAGGYSEGDTSMDINGLQTSGAVKADQEFTIANTRGIYRVTTDADISSEAATIIFYPGLESDVDNSVAVTFEQSTLTNPLIELYVVEYATALAAIREPMVPYHQTQAAIVTVALTTKVIAEVADLITQAIKDIGSGRTEVAKVFPILDTANKELDKIEAHLRKAVVDINFGRTETSKVPAIVDAAATAIEAVDARVTQALLDIDLARKAAARAAVAIPFANTEFGLMKTQVDLAATAAAEGELLINTVSVAGGAPEFMAQANTDIGVAQGHSLTGQSHLQKASADSANASNDLGVGSGEIQAGLTKIREAQVSLQQANTGMGVNTSRINSAIAEIRTGSGFFQTAQGYMQEGNSRLTINASYLQSARGELSAVGSKIQEGQASLQKVATQLQIASSGRIMETWGRTELERVKAKLRGSVPNKYKTSQVYTRE